MHMVNVEDVKRDLSRFLEQVAQGEEVVIASNGNPVAKLVPFQAATVMRVAGYENRFARNEGDLARVKWMIGFSLALTVAILWKLFSA